MSLLRYLLLLLLTTCLALGQAAVVQNAASSSNNPVALVGNIYNEVVAHHPLGVPGGAVFQDLKPFLSKNLLDRIDTNIACQNDWNRKHPDPDSKPPFLEFGLFSGDALRAEPSSFRIEKVESEKDASTRVYVKLTHSDPDESQWSWYVAVVLVQQAGSYVVDDVIFLKEKPQDGDVRLSEYLTEGCDGSCWVGFKQQHEKNSAGESAKAKQ